MSQSRKTKKRSGKQTERTRLLSQLRRVQKRADRLREAFEYEQAVESYTEALKLIKDNPDLADAELEYDLLAGRVACFRRLGNSVSGPRDLRTMRRLAKYMGDLSREVGALTTLVEFATYRAEIPKAERYAKAALRLAKKAGDRKLEADSLLAQGDVERFARDAVTSMEPLKHSLRIYRELGDRAGEARALRRIGRNLSAAGDLTEAEATLHRAIDTARTLGDRYEEAFALTYLAGAQTDTAEQRAHGERALEVFSSIRDRVGQSIIYNNLALLYARLGLYGTAKHFAERAVEMAREMDVDLVGAAYLESLGRAELDHGEHEHARITMQEGLELSLKIDALRIQAYFRLGLGRIALAAKELEVALSEFRKSTDLFRDLGIKADHSVSQAWLGFAHLAKGDWEAAHDQTSSAVARLEALGDVNADYPPQDVWWLHYQVLKATPDEASDGAQSRHQLSQLTDTYAWMVLQRARQIVLGGIETLSDDGLRRNYLNKVEVNRRIIAEWVGGAQERGLDLGLETAQAGNLQEQLKRMLGIGARMNERRDLEVLLDFILDQLIELSGAERVLLANIDASGAREAVAARGYSDEEAGTALDGAASVFDTVSERLGPVLLQGASAGDPRASEPEDVLDSLSVLGLPLISRGRLTGLIYLDNHTIYGPFNQWDVDLLSAFANQAASAIENARLYQGLEQRVADRTAELEAAKEETEQRAAELQIINSVQEGLASKLEVQAIYDLVGDQMREIFHADTVYISFHDKEKRELFAPYFVDKGVRNREARRPYKKGLSELVLESGQPLKLGTSEDKVKAGAYNMPSPGSDKDLNESVILVPIFRGKEVIGVTAVESYERHAFDDSDLRMLQTLTNSMSVALENVRLFDETQDLLQETEQRAAELEIINSVQEGLASKLDLQSIYELIGDRISEIFKADTTYIGFHDRETNEIYAPYYRDKEALITDIRRPYGLGFAEVVLESAAPLRFNNAQEQAKIGVYKVPSPGADEDLNQSVIAVPIISGGKAVGVASVQSYEQDAFDEDDIRLLQTLTHAMSAALENVRLFDETQHLLKETEERAAELEIINSVEQALASKLDMQEVFELVGEKIREVFDAQTMVIMSYDKEADMLSFPYYIEQGQREYPEAANVGGFSAHILKTREPLLINRDLAKRGQKLGAQLIVGEWPKSFLGVPLIIGEEVTGVITLQNIDREDAFDESDLRLLTTLASSMSVSLENVRLFDETQHLLHETEQRAAELEIINSVQEGLASQLDFDAIIELVGEKMREIFNLQNLSIRIYDPDAKLVHFKYDVERGSRLAPIDPIEAIGFSGAVIESRQPIIVNDHMEEAMRKVGSFTFKGTEAAKSLVAVPVISGGQVTGVIQVSDLDRENAFDESDVRLLTTLAASMGVAFENARLFEETNRLLDETEQRAAELEIISSVEQALASKLEVQEVFDLVGDKIRDVFDAQSLLIVTHDAASDLVSYPYVIEKGKRYYPEPAKLADRGFTAHIIKSKEPLMINRDLERHAAEYGAGHIAGEKPKSWLGVPLMVGKEPKGIIQIEHMDREDAFDKSDVRLLTTLASSMSVALENVRLFDETRRRAAEMAALTEIARDVSATLDLTAVLEQIGERAMELLSARTLVLRLLDADRHMLKSVVALGYQAEKFAAQDLQMGEGISGNVAQTGTPEVIADTTRDSRAVHVPGTPEDEPETFMIAPLKVGREVIGTMGMWRAVEGGSFTNEDLEVMVSLSRQAAIAIQNARLFQEVERQKDYSESLVLNSPVAIVTIDEVDKIVSWNPEAETLFGYAHDEAIGQNIDELLVPEEMREESIGLNRQAEAEGSVQITTRRRRKDGSLVDVELHGVGLFKDGKAAGSIAIYHDISELKRTEDDLREQKEFFEGVLTSNPAAIAVANDNVEVIAWNRAAEQLFGYTAQEALGKNLDDLVAKDEELHDEAAQRSDEIKSEREFMRFITQRTRKDSSRVDVEVSAMPVLSGERHVGYIAIYYDISELLEAKLAAEAANEAKSAFLATMSHEIRTPMNAIIGMTSLLLDTELSDEQLEFTEIVRDSGDSLLTIINDILDFSKIEAGRFELESQPFDLRECIEGALDLIAPKASEKQLDLAYEYREGTPEAIHGDVTRLRQIFVNLLNNAVKFTDRGEVVLEVEPHDGKQNELLFCIRDTGIGIPPERMDRLFQSFSQVDVSTSRRYGGTGLGLAISKRLSELMGGTMWVESSPGEGSTFHFTIQAKRAPAPRRAYAEADVTELAGKRILIVDDNPTNRKILTRQLQAWGMSFRDTESPKQALGWIESAEQFEAAILDMHMPDMDGLELAIELRKTVAGRSMPLIMLTSLGGREEVREEERVEFSAFLTKPIKPSQLFNALTEVFAVAGRPRKPEPEVRTIDSHMGSRLPLRILLAEDNAVNQKVALRILSRLGYRADVAGNGLEAIAALRRQPYDVVLMDMQMPELDGLDATRRIRKEIAEQRQPRIIATTANAMEGDRELCLAAGMDDYVSKPLRVDELVRALSESRPLEEVEP